MTERRKVLLIEPDASAAASLRAALGREGWDASVAGDANDGFQHARRAKPDAIVLRDRGLGESGLMLMQRLRSSSHTALIPVVAQLEPGGAQKQDYERWGAQVILESSAGDEQVCVELTKQLARPVASLVVPLDILAQPARLDALARTGLLDTPPEAVFDHVTRLAARLLNVPTVLMSLVDRERQFFKSQVGLQGRVAELRQTPLSHSFCQWVVADRAELIVPDAREHPLLRLNPATTESGVRAYAGVPLHAGSDQLIGSFCAVDSKPRRWGEVDLAALHGAAHVIEGIIALRQAARSPWPLSHEDLRATAREIGRAVAGGSQLLADGEARISAAERADLLAIVGDLGRQLAELSSGTEPFSTASRRKGTALA